MKRTIYITTIILGLFIFSSTAFAAKASTVKVSQDSAGAGGNNNSEWASINSDGSWVGYSSSATNLDLKITNTNNTGNSFIYNTASATSTMISLAKDDPTSSGNKNSYDTSISNDGKWAVYSSDATNLVSNDNNKKSDVFLFNTVSRETKRITMAFNGFREGNGTSYSSRISGDGTMVLYISSATNLVDDGSRYQGCFMYNRLTGKTIRVSLRDELTPATNCAYDPSISADGAYVAFQSNDKHIVHADPKITNDVFLAFINSSFQVESIELISQDKRTYPVGGADPWVSDNGNFISFTSGANTIAGIKTDTNKFSDIYVYDRVKKKYYHASIKNKKNPANARSNHSSVSNNGIVAFQSSATNLVKGDTNGTTDIFIHNTAKKKTKRVNVKNHKGKESAKGAGNPLISADGKHIVFGSNATDLTEAPNTKGNGNIFIRNTR